MGDIPPFLQKHLKQDQRPQQQQHRQRQGHSNNNNNNNGRYDRDGGRHEQHPHHHDYERRQQQDHHHQRDRDRHEQRHMRLEQQQPLSSVRQQQQQPNRQRETLQAPPPQQQQQQPPQQQQSATNALLEFLKQVPITPTPSSTVSTTSAVVVAPEQQQQKEQHPSSTLLPFEEIDEYRHLIFWDVPFMRTGQFPTDADPYQTVLEVREHRFPNFNVVGVIQRRWLHIMQTDDNLMRLLLFIGKADEPRDAFMKRIQQEKYRRPAMKIPIPQEILQTPGAMRHLEMIRLVRDALQKNFSPPFRNDSLLIIQQQQQQSPLLTITYSPDLSQNIRGALYDPTVPTY